MPSDTSPPNFPGSRSVLKFSSPLEADAVGKFLTLFRRAMAAGLLTDSWTLKVFRHNGGKVRVWIDAEGPVTIDQGIIE